MNKKDCGKCIFGIYCTSDGRLTRVCAGFAGLDDMGAAAKIQSEGPCEMFDEGRRLKIEQEESGLGPYEFLSNIPADKKYIYNRRRFSKDPVGICESFSKGSCDEELDGYCYNRFPCTGCMSLDNPKRMADCIRKDFIDAMKATGIPEEKLKDF